ncbi:hypothetical protein GUJ93_ZPchr0003g16780 [Zizania palustris]|uniref:Uncharacterized protein n=1 Tax=Zizania palustris TaxID=103762 RepID=A0A8J5RKH8_ZIZPA|nr:hypothetical protein GUJ93_ZPchr0003g16780 [Zizania palustris]
MLGYFFWLRVLAGVLQEEAAEEVPKGTPKRTLRRAPKGTPKRTSRRALKWAPNWLPERALKGTRGAQEAWLWRAPEG